MERRVGIVDQAIAAESGKSSVRIPDVSGMDLSTAALALAAERLYLLLVKTGKHPGSHVGNGWPAKSTCNRQTIAAWCAENPNAGIAIHTGRSGLIAFDLDVDVLPGELDWLRQGLFQSTRGGRGDRGHYVFASDDTFTSGRLRTADGVVVGDVRSGNTVIVTEPSPHEKSDNGGEYRWITTGFAPGLPDDARRYLSARAGVAKIEHTSVVNNADLEKWYARHTDEREPWRRQALRNHYSTLVRDGEPHHDAMMKTLGWATREVEAGFVSASLLDELFDEWWASFGPDDRTPASGEIEKMLVHAIADLDNQSVDDLRLRGHRNFGTDHRDFLGLFDGFEFRVDPARSALTQTRARFSGVTAAELAAPVAPMRWLVRGVWPQRSAGVLAGEKKTFKTWNLQAMALAVAAGLPMLDQFEVTTPGPVLYLCGEGGRDAFANRHQVIAARYGIASDDLAALPFMAEFDTGELTSLELIGGVLRHLDELQPVLVILDPLYAYHPQNVEASNLYARGPMLARLREMIEPHAALVIGDHFKKGASDGFDLDHISMAGVAQWADTWALQRHRAEPDLANNHYRIETEFSTRRGGGARWDIDWRLTRDADPDVVAWKSADWTVSNSSNSGTVSSARDLELRIVAQVKAVPWTLNRLALQGAIGGRKATTLAAVKRLLDRGELSERDPAKGSGTRAAVLGPGKVVVPLPAMTP